jgi:hypothetical protein
MRIEATKKTPHPWNCLKTLLSLEKKYIHRGTFEFSVKKVRYMQENLTILGAASTDMWPMGTHFWVRDNALIGKRLLFYESFDLKLTRNYNNLGKKLLLSTLSIMSTKSQLTRMRRVILSNNPKFVDNVNNWPQIFLCIKDNLLGKKYESWAHKQDAWQILAHSILLGLESTKISFTELSSAHREFLSLLVPFLAKVKFYKQENSGSWEEIEACRSSVIAWDLALLHDISRLHHAKQFAFLIKGFGRYRSKLPKEVCNKSFEACLRTLLTLGARQLKKKIPYEAAEYPRSDARYRKEDAALIYLLQLNTPHMVAKILNLTQAWVTQKEHELLSAINSLFDPRTGGHKRYHRDSYQRFGFFREKTVRKLKELYGGASGDASKNFKARDTLVPKGPEAAWVHFTWQLSAWAGRRYQKTSKKLT